MKKNVFNRGKFKEIRDQEGIENIIHRHWFNIFAQFVGILFFVALGSGLLFALYYYFPALRDQNSQASLLFVESFFAIFIWIYAFFIWVDYYFDIWIITSERIINIEQKGLFVRSMSEVKFSRIQDVTAEVKGVIPTVLNYGDVYIQTAGEVERFVFRQVPDPYGLKDAIMNLQKERVAEETNELGEMIREEIHKEVT